MSSVPNLFGETSVTIDVGVLKPPMAMLTVIDGAVHPRRMVVCSPEGAALLHTQLGTTK